MEFQNLKLEKAVIEIRYPKAYLLWDRAGSLWTKVLKNWPTLSNIEANPAKTVFRLDLEAVYELVVELEAARVVAHRPKQNLVEFQSIVSTFLAITAEMLDIEQFARVGFRLIYCHETATREAADELMTHLNLIRVPEGQYFGLQKKTISPALTIKFTGEEVGATVRINSQTQVIDFVPAPGFFEMEAINKQSHRVLFDVDYFTVATVDVSQMNFTEWISQIYHLIKRDSNQFLKGS